MKTFIIALIFLLVSTLWHPLFGCTFFTASHDKIVLCGNNEDHSTRTHSDMWFVQPKRGNFGGVYFGFSDHSLQGGMNEHGLCFDSFSAPYHEIPASSKPTCNTSLFLVAMETCSTVEDALALFDSFDLRNQTFEENQRIFVDRSGDCAILEGDCVVRKDKYYQVVTNFLHSRPDYGYYPCWRYDTAAAMLENSTEITVRLFRSIVDAVHVDFTRYSNIYDLKNGVVYLFHNHNYDEFLKINLKQELQKGRDEDDMYSLETIFSNLKMVSPGDEEAINSSSVTLTWIGKAASKYQLYYSTDPEFTGCVPIEIQNSPMFVSGVTGKGILWGSILLGMLCFGMACKNRKKSLLKLIFPLLMIAFMISCVNVGGNESKRETETPPEIRSFEVIVENLQANSTYYWKVTARFSEDFMTESIVKTFSTGE